MWGFQWGTQNQLFDPGRWFLEFSNRPGVGTFLVPLTQIFACRLGSQGQALYDFGMLGGYVMLFGDVGLYLVKNRLLPAFCAFAHGLIRGMWQVQLPAPVTDRFKVLAVVIVKGFMRGFGLGLAILLDASIVRIMMVPAAMKLLGEWNWYLPKWLEWLPNVRFEPGESTLPGGR